jgi:hypothetical protein
MKRFLPLTLAGVLLLAVAAPVGAAGKATSRPFSDWLDAQQSLDLTQPIELQVVSWFEPATGVQFLSDLDGRVATAAGLADGPRIRGTVSERALPDGRGEVSVNLSYSQSITYLWLDENDFADFPNGPELFGYRASEVAAGATPTLGSGTLHLTFIHPTYGMPLPDFTQLAIAPLPGQEVVKVAFHGQARGDLRAASGYPEGASGKAAAQQLGLFQTTGGGATADGFPVEWVVYKPVGN